MSDDVTGGNYIEISARRTDSRIKNGVIKDLAVYPLSEQRPYIAVLHNTSFDIVKCHNICGYNGMF